MSAAANIIHNVTDILVYRPDEPLIFSSWLFWALFLVFMPIYGMLRNNKLQKMLFVTAFSFYFYYKCSGYCILLMGATSLLDWKLSRIISHPECSRMKKRWCVAISLLFSLGTLAVFKYADFAIWNVNALTGSNYQPLDLILPVGISFYTFQSVSYIIDVSKGRVKATETWLEYAFFLSFFPALVAGPIVRAESFLPQISENHRATRRELFEGLWLIMAGVVKKAIIADYIAQYNDLVFNAPGAYTGFESLMGIVGYTMQIYCDFSGYSDLAIGIAMIMGFHLGSNFDFPYRACNLSDFWRRWHISLSTWLRDYIYIPLGGNRRGPLRTYINNFITMLIGGLWHGAAWKFVFWGGMHGVGLVSQKALRPLTKHLPDNSVVRTLSWVATISFVAVMWIFFRADSWHDAIEIMTSVTKDFSLESIPAFVSSRTLWCVLMGLIIMTHALSRFRERSMQWFADAPWIVKLLIFIVIVQVVLELRTADVVPFIYFRF